MSGITKEQMDFAESLAKDIQCLTKWKFQEDKNNPECNNVWKHIVRDIISVPSDWGLTDRDIAYCIVPFLNRHKMYLEKENKKNKGEENEKKSVNN